MTTKHEWRARAQSAESRVVRRDAWLILLGIALFIVIFNTAIAPWMEDRGWWPLTDESCVNEWGQEICDPNEFRR